MRRHLTGRGLEAALVESTLVELCERGYLDDARYAQRFAEDRRALDGWGSERIEGRLRAAGVENHIVEQSVGVTAGVELDAAVAVLRTRMRQPPSDDRTRQRALGLLVRRGYGSELAYDAVRRFERDGER